MQGLSSRGEALRSGAVAARSRGSASSSGNLNPGITGFVASEAEARAGGDGRWKGKSGFTSDIRDTSVNGTKESVVAGLGSVLADALNTRGGLTRIVAGADLIADDPSLFGVAFGHLTRVGGRSGNGGVDAAKLIIASINGASISVIAIKVIRDELPTLHRVTAGNFALSGNTRSGDGSVSATGRALAGIQGTDVVVVAVNRLVLATTNLSGSSSPAEGDVADLVETTSGSGRTVDGLIGISGATVVVDERVGTGLNDDSGDRATGDLEASSLFVSGNVNGDGGFLGQVKQLTKARADRLVLALAAEADGGAPWVGGHLLDRSRADTTSNVAEIVGASITVVAAERCVGAKSGRLDTEVGGTIVSVVALARLAKGLWRSRKEVRVARDGLSLVVRVPTAKRSLEKDVQK